MSVRSGLARGSSPRGYCGTAKAPDAAEHRGPRWQALDRQHPGGPPVQTVHLRLITDEPIVQRHGRVGPAASARVSGHVQAGGRVADQDRVDRDTAAPSSGWPPALELVDGEVHHQLVRATPRALDSLLPHQPVEVTRLASGMLQQLAVRAGRVLERRALNEIQEIVFATREPLTEEGASLDGLDLVPQESGQGPDPKST